ncbi:hypothetical protein BDA96_01G274700 [Sorghum bicolor]|uniref:Uncharacterized protein n=1 Tax=Sorghum bicolor TaxID=4558 RepID=A0A921S353_SORBI|nr:hypothetical protein BDA96_01G274700 [Sorghum bicolor]
MTPEHKAPACTAIYSPESAITAPIGGSLQTAIDYLRVFLLHGCHIFQTTTDTARAKQFGVC